MTRSLFVLAFVILVSGAVAAQSFPGWAQPGQTVAPPVTFEDPGIPHALLAPPTPPGPTPTQVPVDGGLGLLALLGGAYAIRRLKTG